MNSGLLYFRTHADDPFNLGVVQKCADMAQAFRQLNWQIDVVQYYNGGMMWNHLAWYRSRLGARKKSLGHICMFYLWGDRYLLKNVDFQQYEFILIRHLPTHPGFIRFLKALKVRNPKLKVVLEIPTWPYDAEQTGILARIQGIVDRKYREKLHTHVDLILNYGTICSFIWSIPVLQIENGIALSRIPKPRWPRQESKGVIRLIFVGNPQWWHGLDRVIAGMEHYEKSKGPEDPEIFLDVVGLPEPARKLWQARVSTRNLVLYPPREGAELYELLAQASLGIGTLAIHRKGLNREAPLKHRLYAAVGLPLVCCAADRDFPAEWPYVFHCPENDDPVDMTQLVAFLGKCRKQEGGYPFSIREYAEKHLDWQVKLRKLSAGLHRPAS